MRATHTILGSIAILAWCTLAMADTRPTKLRCEYLVNPLAIDTPQPRLSWIIESDRRAVGQVAYQIIAAPNESALAQDGGDLWSSGKVDSDASAQVEYAGKPLRPGRQVFWKVRVWTGESEPSAWSEPASFRVGPREPADWKAKWIGVPVELLTTKPYPPQRPAMMRKGFELKKPVRKAFAAVSALGVYEFRLNGQRVGDQLLAPEWTNYHKRVQYQTYDVTALLKPGANAAGATVAEGWYAGKLGISFIVKDDPRRRWYGDRLRLIAQIDVTYEDGSTETIATDETWKGTVDGPTVRADILDGEGYDARKEMIGWDAAGFNDSGWKAVDIVDGIKAAVVPQPNEPIRVTQQLKAVKVTEPTPGAYVFDFGQNLAGRCRLKISGQAGQTVALRHAEVLNPDGTIYRTNLRINMNGPDTGARQKDEYTLRGGGVETWTPQFTYHGFRYVEVTGLKEKPADDLLVAEHFHSAAPMTGSFDSSSPLLNRLMQNIQWTQRDNMHSTPTDCPQRDERLGWTGDILSFAPTASYNMDMAAFYKKWLQDMRDDQADDGRYPNFAPQPYDSNKTQSGVAAWGDAGVFVAWQAWQSYGDTRLLKEHFESARRWVNWIHSGNPDLLWKKNRNNDYGDWLNGDTLKLSGYESLKGKAALPKDVLATAFFQQSTSMVARMAAVLGRKDDAQKYGKLADAIKQAFQETYLKGDGTVSKGTQSCYALALDFDLVPADQRGPAAERMAKAVEQYNWHISTGFHTTARLMKQLTAAGRTDIAYRLINNRTIPSWGYEIDHGATTIWERWDGWVDGRGFQDPGMNSFCHYSLGAVGEWMYRTIVGITPQDEHPGWAHFIIRPEPGGDLTWVKGAYDSIRGRIATEWKVDGDKLELAVTIPANSAATVYVPAADAGSVTEGGRPAAEAQAVRFVRHEKGRAIYELGSGTYRFASKLPK